MLLATTNKDKFNDFNLLLKGIGIRLALPENIIEINEPAYSLLENAKLKALIYSQKYSDQLVLATDGGAKIPFLGEKWNHVLTKRLSGIDMNEKLTNKNKCKVLLRLMIDADREDRKVLWYEAFAIAFNNKVIYSFEGSSPPGYLLKNIPENFAETGYWIGYLWYKPEFKKTYMQLTEEEIKSAITVGSMFKEDLAIHIKRIQGLLKSENN